MKPREEADTADSSNGRDRNERRIRGGRDEDDGVMSDDLDRASDRSALLLE